ncbi:MAG TPA: dihydropteridine reductase, partial [Thermus scotoductus]|nr:dihydropteridine reductase [Thermus scotoductus]
MTVGVSRVSWVFLGFALWVALFGLGLYSLIARPPRLSAPLPPAAPPRGTLYA